MSRESEAYWAFIREEEDKAAAEERAWQDAMRKRADEFDKNLRQLRRVEGELLTKVPDPEAFVSEHLMAAIMSRAEAERNNTEEAKIFIADNPDYYPCQENYDAIRGYFQRVRLEIVDAAMYQAAWLKLRAAGLIVERPEPEQEPSLGNFDLADEPDGKSLPAPRTFDRFTKRHVGRDPNSLEEMYFSDADIDRMDAETYRRTFGLKRVYRSRRPL
jgi:hypothetical protein